MGLNFKYTTQSWIDRAKSVHNNKYDYSMVVYKNSTEKVVIICKIHGPFSMTGNSHIQKQGCPKCGFVARAKIRATPKSGESLKDKYPEICKDWSNENELGPENYKYSSKKKVKWVCNKCLYNWELSPSNRIRNSCPACSRKVLSDINRLSITNPELIKEWDYNKNYPLIPENITCANDKKVWWTCKKCSESYIAKVCSRTVNKTGCKKCSFSKGETVIYNWLNKNNIKFESQFRIKDCRNIYPLPFDFAIWINNELKLIEFNGSQHYQFKLKSTRFNQEIVSKIKLRDEIKVDFCKNNNIPLLVIPFNKIKNIEDILHGFCVGLL